MEQQELWPENQRTTPQQEMRQENQSQSNNENTDDAAEVQTKLLIGQMLKLSSLSVQYAELLDAEQQSNLGTPVMEVHLLSGLSGMVSLLMSTCDLLRMYTHTLRHLLPTTLSENIEEELLPATDELISELMDTLGNF